MYASSTFHQTILKLLRSFEDCESSYKKILTTLLAQNSLRDVASAFVRNSTLQKYPSVVTSDLIVPLYEDERVLLSLSYIKPISAESAHKTVVPPAVNVASCVLSTGLTVLRIESPGSVEFQVG